MAADTCRRIRVLKLICTPRLLHFTHEVPRFTVGVHDKTGELALQQHRDSLEDKHVSLASPELVKILRPKLLRNWRAEELKMPNVSIAIGCTPWSTHYLLTTFICIPYRHFWSQGLLLRRTRRFLPCRNRRQHSLRLATRGWPGWVDLGGWLHNELVYLPVSPIPLLTGLNVEQLRWSRPTHYPVC